MKIIIMTTTLKLKPVMTGLLLAGFAVPAFAACDPAGVTAIHQVQGAGSASPLAGQTVKLKGVVTGLLKDKASKVVGFYLQQELGSEDADPNTSEGIYVYAKIGQNNLPELKAGEVLTIEGVVEEYPLPKAGDNTVKQTETQLTFTSLASLAKCDAQGVVKETVLKLPLQADSGKQLEALAGMVVTLPQPLYVVDSYDYARYGALTLSSQPRQWVPGQLFRPGTPENAALRAGNRLDRILLDDGNTGQNINAWLPGPAGLSAANTVRVGDKVEGVRAVVAYSNGQYRLQPLAQPTVTALNKREDAPKRAAGTVRVASFNVLNFFNGDGTGLGFPTARGAKTLADFQRQKAKTVSAIRGLDADIVGLLELENDGFDTLSAGQELVRALNEGQPVAKQYRMVQPGVARVGSDVMGPGMLYRPAVVDLQGAAEVVTIGDAQRNRPALIQSFVVKGAGGNQFTLAVNHLKSKGSSCKGTLIEGRDDVDNNDGQGNCNLTRVAAVNDLVKWYQARPNKAGGMLVVGDMNAYAKEDPIVAFEKAGFVNQLTRFHKDQAYSYVYQGESGNLDHALADAKMADMIQTAGDWHINADEPTALEYDPAYKSAEQQEKYYAADAFRSSDHDPLYIDVAATGQAKQMEQASQGGGSDNGIASADAGLLAMLGLGGLLAAWRKRKQA